MDRATDAPTRPLLAGRRILITGGASGIGAGVARLFRRCGATLALVDKSKEQLSAAASSCDAHPIAADLAIPDEATAAVATAAEAMGGLDGVVNVAGILRAHPLEQTSVEDWTAQIAVNLTAPFLVCRAAASYLRASDHGTIVNVSSGIALRPLPSYSAYAASKAGLLAFTKSIAQELAPRVRVNAVCPGPVETPMIEKLYSAEAKSRAIEQYALRRFGQVDEVASAILFLSSTESSFITGISMAVDGGRSFY